MKILVLNDVFFPDTTGGAGRVAYYLCLELSKKGHEVHVITRKINGELPSYEKFDKDFFIHRFVLPENKSLCLIYKEVKNSYSLAKKISNEIKFDLVCIHQSMAAVGPLLSGCLRGIPIFYYFHSPWHEEYLIKKVTADNKVNTTDRIIATIMEIVERRILNRSKKVIVLSKYMREKVLLTHGYPQEKIKIIPGGVDPDRFKLPAERKTSAKSFLNLPLDKTIFLTVRNLVPRMGLESLIEAFNHSDTLREKSLLLIGGKGSLEFYLKDIVKESNLEGSVRFIGYIPDEDLPNYYQAADYFILPTKALEGFGLVILESMACGTPVLGTPVGAIPEVIGAFDNKLILEETNWRSLKEKLEDILKNTDEYHFSPQACRRYVEKNYSWGKVGDMFEKEMKSLVFSMQNSEGSL